jgi:hypothetical protein
MRVVVSVLHVQSLRVVGLSQPLWAAVGWVAVGSRCGQPLTAELLTGVVHNTKLPTVSTRLVQARVGVVRAARGTMQRLAVRAEHPWQQRTVRRLRRAEHLENYLVDSLRFFRNTSFKKIYIFLGIIYI